MRAAVVLGVLIAVVALCSQAGAETWIDPELPEWVWPGYGEWVGSPDGSSRAFNVSWISNEIVNCHQVQYNTSAVGWWNWTIEDTNCTAEGEWSFGPDLPVAVEDGETYSFRVRTLNDLGVMGEWSYFNSTTVDSSNPNRTLTAVKDVDSVTITSSAIDDVSGIESNSIYYCRIESGVEDCRYEQCPQAGPGIESTCDAVVDYGETVVVKFRATATDLAGNVNVTPGPNTYLYVMEASLANFADHYVSLVMGDAASLRVNIRNLQASTDTISLELTGYNFASFVDVEGVVLGPDRRSAEVVLGPYAETELSVTFYSSAIGQHQLQLTATSSLNEDGEACSGDCVTEQDTLYVSIDYPAEFPGLGLPGIVLIFLGAVIVYWAGTRKVFNSFG